MTATLIDNRSTLSSLKERLRTGQNRMKTLLARAGARPLRPDEQRELASLERDVLKLRVEILESRVLGAEGLIEHLTERANLHWGHSALK